jgi:Asp-tRNA(Asn)/Glu-tRNA(Gln) amidotransferase A subunit family amidase
VRAIPDDLHSLNGDRLRALRVGICTCLFGSESRHAEVNEVVMNALVMMERAGATLVEMNNLALDVPTLVDELDVQKYEFKNAINAYLSRSGAAPVNDLDEILASGRFHPSIGQFLRDANAFEPARDSKAYEARKARITELRETVVTAMAEKDVDVLAYPLQRGLAARIEEAAQPERNGIVASLCGFPAIDVPAGFSCITAEAPIGVPIGIDLLGRPWSEALLLDTAFAFERLAAFRTPPLATTEL